MKHAFLSSIIIPFTLSFPFSYGISQDFTTSTIPQRRKPEIIILSSPSLHVRRIREGLKIGYVTNDNKYGEGTISGISHDTIFIGKIAVPVGSLILMVNPNIIEFDSNSNPASYRGMGIIYKKDTSRWRIYCPPEIAYTSFSSYNKALKSYLKGIKKDRQKRNFKPIQDNYVLFNLTRLLILDLEVSYERKLSGKVVLSIEAGYKLGVHQTDPYSMIYSYAQSGPSLIIGPKFYYRDKYYISPLLHLKYIQINGSLYLDPFSDNEAVFMDQYGTSEGISLRFGIMAHAGKTWFDFFLGGGIKYISAHEILYYTYSGDYKEYFNNGQHPAIQNVYRIDPIINLGIKIGLGF